MQDVIAIGFLVILEGLLSFDNALALAAMVKHLPEQQRKKALTYGMFGAFFFRMVAVCFVTYLMQATWLKLTGGIYLLWLGVLHFFPYQPANTDEMHSGVKGFWATVISVELMDIVFSIDSILAAVALSSKTTIVIIGGILGIITMRFVANRFVQLIERFPGLVHSAFGLVALVGAKLTFESLQIYSGKYYLDLEHGRASYVMWVLMLVILASGFRKAK